MKIKKYLSLILTLVLTVLSVSSITQPVYANSQSPGYLSLTDEDFIGEADGEFRYIGNAPYVRIPHTIKGVPVTSYKGMFSYTKVEGVYSDNPNVTDMSWMFHGSKASKLDLSSLDTRNVTDMSWMFAATNAKTIDLSAFDTRNVTDMSYMFYSAKVEKLNLSNFDISSLVNSEHIFANSGIAQLDMSTFSFDSLKTHGKYLIKGLTAGRAQGSTIYLGSRSIIDKLSLEDRYFFGTYAGRTAQVKGKYSRPFMFFNSPGGVMVSDSRYSVPEKIPSGYELATDDDFIVYLPTNANPSMLTSSYRFQYVGTKPYVVIPNKIKGIELTGTAYWGMFSGEDAKHVRGVASNNPRITSMAYMFEDNPSPSLDLQYLDTSNITDMTGMFSGSKATSINLSNFNTKKVVSMHEMFANSEIKTLDLNHFDFTNLLGADGMFENAKATTIKMKNFNLANVLNRNSWVSYATLSNMFKGSAVTSIDLSSLRLDSYHYDSSLTEDEAIEWFGEPIEYGNRLLLQIQDIFQDSSLNTVYVGNAEVKSILETNKPAGLQIVVK